MDVLMFSGGRGEGFINHSGFPLQEKSGKIVKQILCMEISGNMHRIYCLEISGKIREFENLLLRINKTTNKQNVMNLHIN